MLWQRFDNCCQLPASAESADTLFCRPEQAHVNTTVLICKQRPSFYYILLVPRDALARAQLLSCYPLLTDNNARLPRANKTYSLRRPSYSIICLPPWEWLVFVSLVSGELALVFPQRARAQVRLVGVTLRMLKQEKKLPQSRRVSIPLCVSLGPILALMAVCDGLTQTHLLA